MTSSALATRYAGALVDVVTGARSAVEPHQAVAQLRSFEATLKSSQELYTALVSPAVPPSRKKAVVDRLAGRLGLSKITRTFLYVLIDHRRIAAFPAIVDAFDVLLDERLGFARAEVVSALPLAESQEKALVAELERMSGKRVRPRFAVDPALIGGAVARMGSTVYDGSVRGQLQALERRLTGE